MALRTFTDPAGRQWQVWNILPFQSMDTDCGSPAQEGGEAPRGESYTPGLEGGWLCFDSGTEKRRLSPIPEGWEDAPESTLEALCREAAPVRRMGLATSS